MIERSKKTEAIPFDVIKGCETQVDDYSAIVELAVALEHSNSIEDVTMQSWGLE